MIGKGFFVKNRISSDIGAMGNGAVAAIAMVPGRVAEEDTHGSGEQVCEGHRGVGRERLHTQRHEES